MDSCAKIWRGRPLALNSAMMAILDANDACTNDCTQARCGDGIRRIDLLPTDAGYEACDDRNTINDDECTNDCTVPVCGDGIVQDGEVCDDGNLDDTDECTVAL